MVTFIVSIVFILLEQEKNLNRRACENKDFCNANLPSDNTKILEFSQYQKSDKVPFIIYADLQCIIVNGWCQNNPENSSTTRLSKQTCSISLSISIENKHDVVYRGKDCRRKFCEFLIKRARNKNN